MALSPPVQWDNQNPLIWIFTSYLHEFCVCIYMYVQSFFSILLEVVKKETDYRNSSVGDGNKLLSRPNSWFMKCTYNSLWQTNIIGWGNGCWLIWSSSITKNCQLLYTSNTTFTQTTCLYPIRTDWLISIDYEIVSFT